MKIAIISNTDGPESAASRNSAISVMKILETSDPIFVTRKTFSESLAQIGPGRICFLATHGDYAEDGTLQSFLENLQIRHTHSSSSVANILCNKHKTKLFYLESGLPTPPWLHSGISFGNISDTLQFVEKPLMGGSKVGIKVVDSYSENGSYIYEALINGSRELSVSVLGSDRLRALPPAIRGRSVNSIGSVFEIEPDVSIDIQEACQEMAILIHERVGARGVSKTDFLISSCGEIYVIETDCHPGLHISQSTLKQARLAGLDNRLVIEGLLHDAL